MKMYKSVFLLVFCIFLFTGCGSSMTRTWTIASIDSLHVDDVINIHGNAEYPEAAATLVGVTATIPVDGFRMPLNVNIAGSGLFQNINVKAGAIKCVTISRVYSIGGNHVKSIPNILKQSAKVTDSIYNGSQNYSEEVEQ